jgi:hypothetical protein
MPLVKTRHASGCGIVTRDATASLDWLDSTALIWGPIASRETIGATFAGNLEATYCSGRRVNVAIGVR